MDGYKFCNVATHFLTSPRKYTFKDKFRTGSRQVPAECLKIVSRHDKTGRQDPGFSPGLDGFCVFSGRSGQSLTQTPAAGCFDFEYPKICEVESSLQI